MELHHAGSALQLGNKSFVGPDSARDFASYKGSRAAGRRKKKKPTPQSHSSTPQNPRTAVEEAFNLLLTDPRPLFTDGPLYGLGRRHMLRSCFHLLPLFKDLHYYTEHGKQQEPPGLSFPRIRITHLS